MEESTPKEKILKRIRQALLYKSKNPYASIDLESGVFAKDDRDLKLSFADHYTQSAGHFVYCENEFDYLDNLLLLIDEKEIKKVYCQELQLRKEFEDIGMEFNDNPETVVDAHASVTSCEALLSRTGSILISSRKNGRMASVGPAIHIVKAYTSQLVVDIKDAFQLLRNKYGSNLPSMLCFETGPSRTSDIERTIVIGAQGPREVYLFLIDDVAAKS